MGFWVYILMCYKIKGRIIRRRKFTNFYVGQTNNFSERMKEHFSNVREKDTNTYTGKFDYVQPVWKTTCNTKKEAMRLEKEIKSLTNNEKWYLIKG